MGDVALYLLSGGMLDADRNVIHPGDDSRRRVRLPLMQVVIRSGTRAMLVDTGLMPDVVDRPHALQDTHDVDPSWIRAMAGPNIASTGSSHAWAWGPPIWSSW